MTETTENWRQLEWTRERVRGTVAAGEQVLCGESAYRHNVRDLIMEARDQWADEALPELVDLAELEIARQDDKWGYPGPRPFSRQLSATKVPPGTGR